MTRLRQVAVTHAYGYPRPPAPIPVTVAALTPEGEHERQMASTIRVDESGIHVRVLDTLMPMPDSEGHAIADLLHWPRRMHGVMDGGQPVVLMNCYRPSIGSPATSLVAGALQRGAAQSLSNTRSKH